MRITCPNCTAHFEVPSELLGRKGRSLKCASCGHSWYQTPQVETIDLAEIMGEEYAAKARADMGAPPKGSPQAQAQPRAQQAQQRYAQVPPPPVPGQRPGVPGGPPPQAPVSLMGRQPPRLPLQQAPIQSSWNSQQRVPRVAAPWQQPAQQGMPAAMPVGGANPSWYQQQPPPGSMPGAPGQPPPPTWAQQPGPGGMPGGPGAAPWQGQQQMPGAAPMPMGAQPPWYQPDALGAPPPGAYQQQQPFGPQGMMPGQQMPPGIPPGGQSWVQNQGQQRQMPPPGSQMSVLNMAPQQRGPVAAPLSGQSMIGPDGQQMGPGEGAVSWMQNPGQQIPGMPAQGMQLGPNQMMGPGGMPVSQMGQQIAAPGQAARSLMDGTVQAPGMGGHSMMGGQQVQAPGMGAQSMMTGEHVQAPNMGAQSMLSSEWVVAPGQIAQSMIDGSIQAPGQAARSMMDGSIQAPGLAAQSMLDGSIQAPGDAAVSMMDGSIQAPGQAAQSVLQAEGPRGEHPDGGVMTPEQTACATEEEARAAKADPTLVTDEKKSKADPTLVTDEKKGDGKEPLWTGAKEDEELVDPDADRPDFGGAADEEGASDAAAAARAEAFKFERKKPLDPAYVTAGLMAFALIACGAVVWTQRATLMQWWPGFAALYEKTGMAPKNPGDGLRLAQSGMRLQRVGGVETLVVKGYISNISQASRPVPGLRLQLTDAKNEVVQEITSAAPKTTLDAGASVDYELRLELPDMGKAKNVIVSWQG